MEEYVRDWMLRLPRQMRPKVVVEVEACLREQSPVLEAEGVFLHQEVSVLLSWEKTRNYRQFGLVLEAQKQVFESEMVERGEVVVK